MNATEWIAAYAEQLGVEPPTADELKAILISRLRPPTPPSVWPARWPAG
jgi:hypothetical protein